MDNSKNNNNSKPKPPAAPFDPFSGFDIPLPPSNRAAPRPPGDRGAPVMNAGKNIVDPFASLNAPSKPMKPAKAPTVGNEQTIASDPFAVPARPNKQADPFALPPPSAQVRPSPTKADLDSTFGSISPKTDPFAASGSVPLKPAGGFDAFASSSGSSFASSFGSFSTTATPSVPMNTAFNASNFDTPGNSSNPFPPVSPPRATALNEFVVSSSSATKQNPFETGGGVNKQSEIPRSTIQKPQAPSKPVMPQARTFDATPTEFGNAMDEFSQPKSVDPFESSTAPGSSSGFGDFPSATMVKPAFDAFGPNPASGSSFDSFVPTSFTDHSFSASPSLPQKGSNATLGTMSRALNPAKKPVAPLRKKEGTPIWRKSYFSDLFLEYDNKELRQLRSTDPLERLRQSVRAVRDALFKVHVNSPAYMDESDVLGLTLESFDCSAEIFDRIPVKSGDHDKFLAFLEYFMDRVKGLQAGGILISPVIWTTEDVEYAALAVLHRFRGNSTADFTFTFINLNKGLSGGLDYHPINLDTIDGSFVRNASLELNNIPNAKIYNSCFWLLLFKPAVFSSTKFDVKYLYERVIPFLTTKPLLLSVNPRDLEFVPVPVGDDCSFINTVFECVRYVSKRIGGLDFKQSTYVPMLVRWNMLNSIEEDLFGRNDLTDADVDSIRFAVQAIARCAGFQVDAQSTASSAQLSAILSKVQIVQNLLDQQDSRRFSLPRIQLEKEEFIAGVGDWPLFGRFRRDVEVDSLAGASPKPPILRPIEMTLVPEKVSTVSDVAIAMRHCLNLCVLLANQRSYVRNSYTLRICLIEHLFIRVIPLPLAINHQDRESHCFWHAQSIRYETQADILRLLSMLCRHFATATLSVKSTRSGDATRMLTFACMATICDATLRKIACDIPAPSSLHYAGEAPGPCYPFGFDLGTFGEESEYLKFVSPETAAARTQVLDYFYQMKKVVAEDHTLFRFERGNECGPGERQYIDQLCLQMGFRRGREAAYIANTNTLIIDHYPEIGFFRDLIFMFKLVMVPTSDKLPELRQWDPEECGLVWGTDEQGQIFTVKGFGKTLECSQQIVSTDGSKPILEKVRQTTSIAMMLRFVGLGSRTPRVMPSQANPSVLLGEQVDTEDDILHVRDLPDFDNTLPARDSELMLQYLTAPYMRIPLLLNFFAVETRLKALRNTELQEVLDSALFEPGKWQEESLAEVPTRVPAPSRNHLCTPAGLLFNEIIVSPRIVLESIQTMLERVIDMDTGHYSELGSAILYVVRLAIKVEGYLLFLHRNHEFRKQQANAGSLNGAYDEAQIRGFSCSDESIEEAMLCQSKLRDLIEDKVFKIIVRWTKKSKTTGQITQACILHAHLAYLYRNVEPAQLNTRIVFTLLSSQIFLFNNFKYDLDLESTEKKSRTEDESVQSTLIIPQIELFGIFQRNRAMVLRWLLNNPPDRNLVMDGILQMVEGSEPGKDEYQTPQNLPPWVTISKPGFSFVGRFTPQNEISVPELEDQLSVKPSQTYEQWLTHVSTVLIKTEVNVQLGEFTIMKKTIAPLPPNFDAFDEFNVVFRDLRKQDILQCATIETKENRVWVRLVGLGYDLQVWKDDVRSPVHAFTKTFDSAESWIVDIISPWVDRLFSGVQLFVSSVNVTNSVAVLIGMFPPATPSGFPTMKEIVVFRYPRIFHIYNVVEYGRRWYRTQIFTSDTFLSNSDLRMSVVKVDGRIVEVGGSIGVDYEPAPSLIIQRTTLGLGNQTFIPNRLLFGLLPESLIDQYLFWQNEDDSLTGYMQLDATSTVARSFLHVDVVVQGRKDPSGFGNALADAIVSRNYILEKPGMDAATQLINMDVDPSKPVMYLVNLLATLRSYTLESSSGKPAFTSAEGEIQGYKSLVVSPEECQTLHALIRMVLRLESMSNIIAWSKDNPGSGPVSIDLIELPRLRLTFEKAIVEGKVRYNCIEQAGLYLTGYSEELQFAKLLEGIPRFVLLRNIDGEFFVLVPSIAKPVLMQTTAGINEPAQFAFAMSLTNQEWVAGCGESTFFIYPIHTSGCFLSSRSVASSLYLLVIRLMTRQYKDAFRLIESCVCDSPFSPQEQQIYDQIKYIRDEVQADVHACRLKMFFVTFGCSAIMPFQFDLETEMTSYVSRLKMVSSYCRLSPEEELFIISTLPEIGDQLYMVNRERLIQATFGLYNADDASFTPGSRNFVPLFPPLPEPMEVNNEPVDLNLLDTDQPSTFAWLKKLTIGQYARPEKSNGVEVMKMILQLSGSKGRAGFFLLYELMTEHLELKVLPGDSPYDIGAMLFAVNGADGSSGLQIVILKLMLTHPALARKMPAFEDKRRLKLPKFTGLDIFQSHIKAAAGFLRDNMGELDMAAISVDRSRPYRCPVTVEAAPTIESSPDYTQGRCWLNPSVKDFFCASRIVARSKIPASLRSMTSYFSAREISYFMGMPLHSIDLRNYVDQRKPPEGGSDPESGKLPVKILDHPSSQSYIARLSVSRLAQDYRSFVEDERSVPVPVLKALNSETQLNSEAEVNKALEQLNSLICALAALREHDMQLVKAGVGEVHDFCNGEVAVQQGNVRALGHRLLQKAGAEASLDFDYLAACTAVAGSENFLRQYNPFLSQADSECVCNCVMLLMMTTNRVNHVNLALQQSRSLVKLLNKLKNSRDPKVQSRLRQELTSLSENLAATLVSRRNYTTPTKTGDFEIDPRFLLFEFCHGLLLRSPQVVLIRKFIEEMKQGRSICHQMIMGAGKTTVVGPLLAMLLANADTLVFEVVPSALLDFSAGVLRDKFGSGIRKPVFTFDFERYHKVTSQLLSKFKTAKHLRAVVVTTPSAVKSFMLKFIEICHNLNRQKHLNRENVDRKDKTLKSKISKILGYSKKTTSSEVLSSEDVRDLRGQARICEEIFGIMRSSIELMDEVDMILHPLKSELNWPLGVKEPLDFTRSHSGNGIRWAIPSHLLDAIFACCGIPVLADIANSRLARSVLDELEAVIAEGISSLQIQTSPHLVIVSRSFYDDKMKMVLSKWLLLWMRARKLPGINDEEIIEYLMKGLNSAQTLTQKVKTVLDDDHVKMLNLGHDWLDTYLPFVLQKINRVHFGLLQVHDIRMLENDGVKIPKSRKLTAVPFVAKDVPSRASEFAHPDVLIGLTILAFRYEGLRKSDFYDVIYALRQNLEDESGPFPERPSCQLFEHWVLSAGKFIRGSKRKGNASRRTSKIILPAAASGARKRDYDNSVNIFAEVFTETDDLIWPLQLIEPRDKEQFDVLFPLLSKLPHTVMYFLNELIFPEVLAHQGLKLSTCGQELGGEMLFGRRIGFSGTPSDILPKELGSCQYERGSDGRIVTYLTSPEIVTHVDIPTGWTVHSILDYIAAADPPFHALIDTGALITGMSNKAVAEYLLTRGLSLMKGVVYLDEFDRQMVLLRKGLKVVKLAESGLEWGERFTFYDQVHTTGMDIKQAVDSTAILTLGKDMVFRDYAQGAFRMRGIGKGQRIVLMVVPEIAERIAVQVALGAGAPSPQRQTQPLSEKQFLRDVLGWLLINSMRIDGMQFNLCCEQSVANVWRKRAFQRLRREFPTIDSEKSSDAIEVSLQVFRERIDHEIENSIPQKLRYSVKIANLIESHKFV